MRFRPIKMCPALFPSYIACVIAKSSTELQSRHRGKKVLFNLAHKRCLHVYLFVSNKWLRSPQRACRLMVIALAPLASVHLVHLLLLIKTVSVLGAIGEQKRESPLSPVTISIIQHVGVCQFSCWERLNTDHYRGRAAREKESTQKSQREPCSIID